MVFNKIVIAGAGFTLIELLFVFAVFAILSTFGIASFVSYSRAQILSGAVLDVATSLNVAKSRASSQVVPGECGPNSLSGYKLSICGLPTSSCITPNTYELHGVCGLLSPLIATKRLPNNIQFSTDPLQTTSTSFFFKTLSGLVEGAGQVRINGYTSSMKIIQIDSLGNISIN